MKEPNSYCMQITFLHTGLYIHFIQDYKCLQNDLDLITQWLDRNLLELNLAKCKYMLLTRRVSNSLTPKFIKLKGEEIECVKEYKYLQLLLTKFIVGRTYFSEMQSGQKENWVLIQTI